MNKFLKGMFLISVIAASSYVSAADYSASFKNTDIQEFINTVSRNLHKTIIIDPSVKGMVNVRSYDILNDEQYYQFFLSALDVYGYAVVPMNNGILKVVKASNAKLSAIPVADDYHAGVGDEVVTRVISVKNVSVRDLSPLLRQLNDNAGVGNVVHYEPSNVLLITGRAAVVNRLVDIVHRVDIAGIQGSSIIKLKFASADDIVKIVSSLNKADKKSASTLIPEVVADNRLNAVVISGEQSGRERMINMIRQLDHEQKNQGNTKVFYLKYAQAKNLVSVLAGSSKTIQAEKTSTTKAAANNIASSSGSSSGDSFNGKDLSIVADEETNALVITAQPDIMQELERIINKLDIRRAQVLVEAVIVEMQDSDALNFGVQWASANGGGTQFTGTGLSTSTIATGAAQYKSDGTISDNAASSLSSFNGIAAGFYSGDWGGLVTALSTNAKSNILATPSIVTLDNKEAEFNVGQEVPVVTGSQTSSTGSVYSTVERKTVGTKLKVVPQINEGDSVLLDIEQEVSSVASTSATDSSSSSSSNYGATFNTRTIKNAVLVKSGETVVLGGLLNNQTSESLYKVPLLGDIPLLGYLFRYNSTSTSKQNLMVFIHPIILTNQKSYSDLSSDKYKSYQKSSKERLDQKDPLALPVPSVSLPDEEKE